MFQEKTEKLEETLLVVCNFAPVVHEKFQMGVPFHGKYKEIFNSDDENFGGWGVTNPRVKTSKKEEWDERAVSIVIKVAPLGVQIFSCTPVEEKKNTRKRRQYLLRNDQKRIRKQQRAKRQKNEQKRLQP